MTLYTSIVPSSKGLTTEQLKVLMNCDVEKRKSILQMEFEAKMKRFAEKQKLTEQRVVNLAKRRQVEKLAKIARNNNRIEEVKYRKNAIDTAENYRRLNLAATLKNRDRMKMKQIAKAKNTQERLKQKKLLQQYCTRVVKQEAMLEENAALIDWCIVKRNLYKSYKPKKKIKEPKKILKKTRVELPKPCSYVQVSEINVKIKLIIVVCICELFFFVTLTFTIIHYSSPNYFVYII